MSISKRANKAIFKHSSYYTKEGVNTLIDVYMVEKNKIQDDFRGSNPVFTVDSGLVESYIQDEATFYYFKSEGNISDTFILEWRKLFQAMHDLKTLQVETMQDDFTIDELYRILEADEIHSLKHFLFRVVQDPAFSQQNYVVAARIARVQDSLVEY